MSMVIKESVRKNLIWESMEPLRPGQFVVFEVKRRGERGKWLVRCALLDVRFDDIEFDTLTETRDWIKTQVRKTHLPYGIEKSGTLLYKIEVGP